MFDRAPAARRITARLGFRHLGGRTFLGDQFTPHPFHITRPFALDGDPPGFATLYLQSSSGGLYGDDDLALEVVSDPGARLHLTTQAATVVHAGRGGTTRQRMRIHVEQGAFVEYLPDPLILFPQARFAGTLELFLAPGAQAIVSDSFLVHDPDAAGAGFDRFDSRVAIHAGGRAIHIDHLRATGADWQRTGAMVVGTVLLAGCSDPKAVTAGLAAHLGHDSTAAGAQLYWGVEAFPARSIVTIRLMSDDPTTHAAAMASLAPIMRRLLTGWDSARRRK